MNRDEARLHTIRLMTDHGLISDGWSFGWLRTKRVLGRCSYGPRVIALATAFVDVNDLPTVEQTILHEIAHALAGPGTGHGSEWRSIASSIGVKNPRAVCGADEVVLPKGRYRATCETCGHVSYRHRMTTTMRAQGFACSPCCKKYAGGKFDPAYRLVWEDTSLPPRKKIERRQPVAAQTATSEGVQTSDVKTEWTASEIAGALRVDSKTFRAWLRKTGNIFGTKSPQSGRYVFNEKDVREIVHVWQKMN